MHCLKTLWMKQFGVLHLLQKLFPWYRARAREGAYFLTWSAHMRKRRQISHLIEAVSSQFPRKFQLRSFRLSSWAHQPPYYIVFLNWQTPEPCY